MGKNLTSRVFGFGDSLITPWNVFSFSRNVCREITEDGRGARLVAVGLPPNVRSIWMRSTSRSVMGKNWLVTLAAIWHDVPWPACRWVHRRESR